MERMKIETEYTKQAFSEARQKIKPLAFTILNDNFIKTYYKENYKTMKGYLLLAIDGSDIEIPNTENLRKEYGEAKNQRTKAGIGTARAKSSMLYDVLNKIVITSIITKYKEAERNLAVKNIENLKELITQKQIITFDRGYPSIALLKYLEQNSIKYVMRTSKTFCNEILNVKTQDEVVKIPITKRVLKTAKDMNIDITEDYESEIKTRVVKIVLNTGETEILITNLTQDEFTFEELGELYFKRWGIEVKYNELKNKFEIENFSGVLPIVIEQDFYANIYLSNLATLIEEESIEEAKLKYPNKIIDIEYKINKSILIGKLKYKLIEIIIEDNENNQAFLLKKLVNSIIKNIIYLTKDLPPKPSPRKKKPVTNKYPATYKKVL